MVKVRFFIFCLFSYITLFAQIKPIVIYSGEYCVERTGDNPLYYKPCQGKNDSSGQKKHIFELVLLDNREFWAVQNSRYTFHRDSLQFITGTWKIDSQNYVLTVDSVSKRFVHFKNSEYRPPYFKKAFFKTPNRAKYLDAENYNFILPASNHNISQEGRFIYPKECFCFIVLTQTLIFPIELKNLPIQFYLESPTLSEMPRVLYKLKN